MNEFDISGRHAEKNCLFSVRENLMDGGEQRECIKRCFTNAKRFLDTTSITELLSLLLERGENRRVVGNAIADILHVGFIIPNGELTIADIGKIADETCFGLNQSVAASTVIARELGELQGIRHIPTTIFTAYMTEACGCSKYVETFIPIAKNKTVKRWIDAEVGTHIGLTLAKPTALMAVQDAFLSEGFKIPRFMQEGQMVNINKGCSVIYYEKLRGNANLRIEVLMSNRGTF